MKLVSARWLTACDAMHDAVAPSHFALESHRKFAVQEPVALVLLFRA
jgi:hypothetical protein